MIMTTLREARHAALGNVGKDQCLGRGEICFNLKLLDSDDVTDK